MRIRKRPSIIPLPPSSSTSSLSQYSDPSSSSSSSLHHQTLLNGGRRGEATKNIIDHWDLQVQLHTKPINIQVKDEKGVGLDPSPSSSSSPPKALDAQLLNNNGRSEKSNKNGKKRRRSPAVLMEGSRCSRVNGRGWQCSQQTLIGYSLCEHHLGKGRIKSVTSVHGGAKAVINNSTNKTLKKKNDLNLYDDGGDDSRLAAQVLASLQQESVNFGVIE